MAHRIFRLSISPEDVPEVRRVVDFDGRSSLAELHAEIAHLYELDSIEHLYAFFMSGRFWDGESAFFDPRTQGRHADKALLFRLGLRQQQTFAYLLDFGAERRFLVTVVEVRDAERPLAAPVLVESVGEVWVEAPDENDESQDEPRELAALVPLAEAFLDSSDELAEVTEKLKSEVPRAEANPDEALAHAARKLRSRAMAEKLKEALPQFRKVGESVLALFKELGGNLELFQQLDEWLLARSLSSRLLDLPLELAEVGETELALGLAREMLFIHRELHEGDIAVILARAGRREEAIAQAEKNLDGAVDRALVESKVGDVYSLLDDHAAAEAYYREALRLAQTREHRVHTLFRLVKCVHEAGRHAEAVELLEQARRLERGSSQLETEAPVVPTVGRNEPCPCGSGKKYKKCHGVSG